GVLSAIYKIQRWCKPAGPARPFDDRDVINEPTGMYLRRVGLGRLACTICAEHAAAILCKAAQPDRAAPTRRRYIPVGSRSPSLATDGRRNPVGLRRRRDLCFWLSFRPLQTAPPTDSCAPRLPEIPCRSWRYTPLVGIR